MEDAEDLEAGRGAEDDNDMDVEDENDERIDEDDTQDPHNPLTDSPSRSQVRPGHRDLQTDANRSTRDQHQVGLSLIQGTNPSHAAVRPGDGLAGSQSQTGVGSPSSQPNPTVLLTSPSPYPQVTSSLILRASLRPSIRVEALAATVYDIVPTIAAPCSTSINAVTATPDLRWAFTGGADGYIRKFNWVETANGKVMLTVAQRHPFVDSVTKAGVLMSYWENEEPQVRSTLNQQPDDNLALSPVYSLAVQSQGLWLLSGLDSGGINLQSIRHDEGKRITCLRKHTSAVSVLTLAEDEKSVLSGSWDKDVHDWDLNTGQTKRSFEGSGGQISAIEIRPMSSLPVPEVTTSLPVSNGTMSDNNGDRPTSNGTHVNGSTKEDTKSQADSPTDSLFGGDDADSLFGDDNGTGPAAPSGGNFGDDDDDDFSRAIANGIQQDQNETPGLQPTSVPVPVFGIIPPTLAEETDIDPTDAGGAVQSITSVAGDSKPPIGPPFNRSSSPPPKSPNPTAPATNGLPHSDESSRPRPPSDLPPTAAPHLQSQPTAFSQSETTFLAASIDGTLRIWDKRQPQPVACILPQNTPPWCMNACWSPSGNSIYAGRRNGTVEEYNLHRGLNGADRTFKFPNGSGPVSAVRAMPNGRHLIW